MSIAQKIINYRKEKGLTQEELASLTKVTARTIQRIENEESLPRAHTIKSIAAALNISFEDLTSTALETESRPVLSQQQSYRHFLIVICLSSFSFIIIPYLHFLIPNYLLRKTEITNPRVIEFAQKVVRNQIYWLVAFHLSLLLIVCINIFVIKQFHAYFNIHYLWVVLVAYLANAILIGKQIFRIHHISF